MVRRFSEMLKSLRKEKGLNQADLGEIFGKSPSTIGNWETGVSEPNLLEFQKITEYFGVKADLFLHDEVRYSDEIPLKNEKSGEYVAPVVKKTQEAGEKQGIPLYPIEVITNAPGKDVSIYNAEGCYFIPEFKTAGAEFIIRVKGASMYPKYSSGDLIGVRKINDLAFFQWGKVYLLDTEQGPLIKRLFPHNSSDYIICHSDNDAYPRFEIPRSSIRNIYIAIGVVRFE